MNDTGRPRVRLDKWLWFARFFKSRSLCARAVSGGHVRLNGTRVTKPAQVIGPGDTLTFTQARRVRVVTVVATGTRRGPASEAQALYEDRSPAPEARPAAGADRHGRPTKKDRRAVERLRDPGSKGP